MMRWMRCSRPLIFQKAWRKPKEKENNRLRLRASGAGDEAGDDFDMDARAESFENCWTLHLRLAICRGQIFRT